MRSFLCVLFLVLRCANAFVVKPSDRIVVGLSKQVLLLSAEDNTERPSWIELPRAQESDGLRASLPSAEIVVGRIAMVGSLSLLFTEFTTGASFSDQFMSAFGFS